MNESAIWLLIVIAVGLTIQFIILSMRHEKLLREHSQAIRHILSQSQVEKPWDYSGRIKGVCKYIQIIAWIGVLFCVCVCIHYISIFYPRHISSEPNNQYIENLGIDYWGIIVGFMALLVTLLVGWQIYATIRARQEINDTRKDIEENFKNKLRYFEDCCKERGEQIDKINQSKQLFEEKIDAKLLDIEDKLDVKYRFYEARLYFAQGTTLSLFADLEARLEPACFKPFENQNTKEVKFQYSMAYRYFFEALVYYAHSNENYTAMEACISNMQINLKRLSDSDEKFEIGAFNRCNRLYDKFIALISENGIDVALVERVRTLHDERIKIQPYDISKETGIKVVSVDSDSEAVQHLFQLVKEAREKRKAEETARKAAEADKEKGNNDNKGDKTKEE